MLYVICYLLYVFYILHYTNINTNVNTNINTNLTLTPTLTLTLTTLTLTNTNIYIENPVRWAGSNDPSLIKIEA